MILLEEVFNELITEDANGAKLLLLQNAIKNKMVVTIDYRGPGTIMSGKRDIEPVCLGVTKRGRMAVRAWLRQGASDTPMNRPGWRLFKLEKITSVTTKREVFNVRRPNFNPNGDRSLVKVFQVAKI